jgi:hypothetical protein
MIMPTKNAAKRARLAIRRPFSLIQRLISSIIAAPGPCRGL